MSEFKSSIKKRTVITVDLQNNHFFLTEIGFENFAS